MDNELIQGLQERINILLKDPLLNDISEKQSLQDIDTLIAIEQGHAYRIQVDRNPLDPVYVVVRQASTVQQLKKLIRLELERMEPQNKHVSWKYIWRSYCLILQGQRLIDDKAVMSQLGIRQNSVLRFSRLGHQKGQHRKAWYWYR
ncbi:hypothetical protein J3Q64DRAFT_1232342 [Phycomyces blakesleeanus]|uniref:SNRNP25 ubiquitin-like domain-containing protein n=2 Tax=Phycomyces blakesleeanus TaxID=4837 RepID=A0A167NWQ0_PHYB8|nr:hypothetical protein PHYBLDRAFT_142276 [Phycomyces blakesleeanus NRRL 1555(-)]OAD76769.1 hypothetical protein PHYBLDRAFT_142276 [Phycomyces blakesleeanus NRRL 1555(-)]|eukprot:XP_018294809.1 hypothetical protein PHYBLDRAFT_142276 [Phycomyces blakesleeanus NRRL 1555(-)]